MDDPTRAQLSAIAEMTELAGTIGCPVWLRGGWAMDFYLGEVTRAHEDVDWFVMHNDVQAVVESLVAREWTLQPTPSDNWQPDLLRHGVDFGVQVLARNDEGEVVVACGPYREEVWPEGMIDDAVTGEIDGVRCAAISPQAQIEIKRMMPVWTPHLARRVKDAEDIRRLESALEARNDKSAGLTGPASASDR